MPIFEYRCKKCDATYEKIVFNREAPPPPCPKCGSDQVEKLISAPGACGVSSGSGSSGFSGGSPTCGSGFT